ncbi:src kinase-associated phosphoprotein 2 [Patella vulgata]|uniref:src kinase-associated phosphoprotein 2 n=1 Tax=Patella vulgata TaxID=6465 RepID=UPI0021808C30|nr:src kinase-associated phosphoprotein 2 [Patella vulgata]
MTSYNESIRQILIDVQTFMNETLKNEKLSDKAKKQKNKIADTIHNLQEEYSALKPDIKEDSKLKVPAELDESVFTTSSVNSEEEVAYSENIKEVSAVALDKPLITGYLEKKRKGLIGKFSYQRRYCVIHTAVLYYFEKPTDKKQKGAFHLNGYEFRPAPHLVRDASKKDLSFELVAPGKRTYEFLAENKGEFDSWKESVELCHSEPVSEELYEFIDDVHQKMSSLPKKEHFEGDGEEYEAPVMESDEVYEAIDDDTNKKPPKGPEARKVSTISLPKSPPPPIPSTPIPDVPPVPPPSRRDLPAVPNTPLPAVPNTPLPAVPKTPLPPLPGAKRMAKLDIPDMDPNEDYENMYYGKWNCSADSDNELVFEKGDIIHVLSKDFEKENWWVGELKGSIGLVPKEYLAKAYELAP